MLAACTRGVCPVRSPTLGPQRPAMRSRAVAVAARQALPKPMAKPSLPAAPAAAAALIRRGMSTVTRAVSVEETSGETMESWSHNFGAGSVSVVAIETADGTQVNISTTHDDSLLLHWAVDSWTLPPRDAWPADTNQMDDKAVQTKFKDGGITINFPGESCPRKMVFVLTTGQDWYNKGGSDFTVAIAPPSLDVTIEDIVALEQDCCLFQRYQKALGLSGEMEMVGDSGMALLFTWLRFSANKQLRWYHSDVYNYQGKDMASTQKCLAQTFQRIAQTAKTPMSRSFARMTLAGLPRGGGNGDDIRMTILNILRDNGIKEGHRPGIECRFLQQWHQKLHSNTTPEDIAICEAYLHFLHTGMWDDFWGHLWENHKLTRESLAEMKAGWRNEDGLTGPGVHLPQLIGGMKHLLWILKVTHSGANMDTAMAMARGYMDGETCYMVDDLLANRNEWWVPGKIVEVREKLQWNWKNEGSSRDVMLLDIALESYFRTCVERTDFSSLSGDDLLGMVELVLRNGCIALDHEELGLALKSVQKLQGEGDRWSPEWSLKAKATLEYAAYALGGYMDRVVELVEPHAKDVGKGAGIDQSYITNFAEEVVRGHPLAILSTILSHLQPSIASAAGLGSWQVVSAASPPIAEVLVTNLADIQGQKFERPTIVISEVLGGLEDVPEGVVGVLSGNSTDVLSHIAIRARNQGVLLASCLDKEIFSSMSAMGGKSVSTEVLQDGEVFLNESEAKAQAFNGSSSQGQPNLSLTKPPPAHSWVVRENDFLNSGLVGGKSKGLAALRAAAPAGVGQPSSIALPYGAFERALEQDGDTASRLQTAMSALDLGKSSSDLPSAELSAVRKTISGLCAPDGLAAELGEAGAAAGIKGASEWVQGGAPWQALWTSVKGVWASKWSDRAWLSRRALGIPDSDLYMAVLVQEALPAEYAFVLHTANPVTGAKGEVVGEVVKGLGEVLVSNTSGSALFFVAPAGGSPAVLSYPSKTACLAAPEGGCLIARSDSNGEDLEDFAGAGLYDSILTQAATEHPVDYAEEPLMWDNGFCQQLMDRLVELGKSMEASMGSPQDVEGLVVGGDIYVVQSRPQILKN